MAETESQPLDPRTALDGLYILFTALSSSRPLDYEDRRKWIVLRRSVYQEFGRISPQSDFLDNVFHPDEDLPLRPEATPRTAEGDPREDLADIGLFLVDALYLFLRQGPPA